MNPNNYARVREVYEAASEMEASRRAAFLAKACADDPSVRSEVERLLRIREEATGFLAEPAILHASADGALASRFSPGDLVGDRFEIRQHIATGGMGEVYRARDRNLDRDVALKFLPPHLSARRDLVERLKREARAISSLNHPNICSLYDFCWHGDTGYLVMEYLEGETLRERIAAGARTTPEIIDFAIQISEGLVAAHGRGLIHRDIKPANLFVTRHGQVKLMDFGLAKPVQESLKFPVNGSGETTVELQITDASLTIPGTITGTMAYMSPEQACGEPLDARTDLFSVGAVLYEMSTGQKPFTGESLAGVRTAILHEEPAPAIRLRPDLPAELNRIISKALQKNTSHRYATAGELLRDLKELKRRESRRELRKLRWVAAASGVLASGIIATFAWYEWVRPAKPIARNIVPARLTTNDAETPVMSAELSPDGTLLAYSDARGVTVRPLQREDRRLIPATSGLHVLNWSPDGKSLLLGRPSTDEILTVPAAGGPLRSLGVQSPPGIELTVEATTNVASVLTRDGRRLCSINQPEGYLLRDEAFSKDWRLLSTIWAAGMGPAHVEFLRLSDCSRFVPDAGQTAALTPPDVNAISWKRVRSIYWTSPTKFVGAETQLSPMADSTIWSVEIDPLKLNIAGVEQIARLPGLNVHSLRASPDGKTIIFQWFQLQQNVYISELDKSGRSISPPRRLTADERSDRFGEWLPDSRSLLVMSDWNGSLQIFRRPADGGDGELLGAVGTPSHVRVSGDGKWILYASAAGDDYRAANTRLMRMPITGGPSEEIFPVGRNLLTHNCAWMPAGPCIISERHGKDIATGFAGTAVPEHVVLSFYDPLAGRGRELARIENAGLTAAISPDGKAIATLMGNPSRSIRLYSPDGRIKGEVKVQRATDLGSLSWTADSRGWFCGDMAKPTSAPGGIRLLRVDLDGRTRVLWDRSGLWAKPSRDGKHLAMYGSFQSSNVWAIHIR